MTLHILRLRVSNKPLPVSAACGLLGKLEVSAIDGGLEKNIALQARNTAASWVLSSLKSCGSWDLGFASNGRNDLCLLQICRGFIRFGRKIVIFSFSIYTIDSRTHMT